MNNPKEDTYQPKHEQLSLFDVEQIEEFPELPMEEKCEEGCIECEHCIAPEEEKDSKDFMIEQLQRENEHLIKDNQDYAFRVANMEAENNQLRIALQEQENYFHKVIGRMAGHVYGDN